MAPEFPDVQARLSDGACPVPDCPRKVPFGRLACVAHWYALPIQLRRLISRSWQARQADPRNREAVEEHEHWRGEAFRFWSTGKWRHPVQGGVA